MRPRTVLRLYPRVWRERYADEFLEACGDAPIGFQQTIDILCGAIDARFVSQSHLVAAGRNTEGVRMSVNLKALCARPAPRYGLVDGVKGAIALIVTSLLFVGLGRVGDRLGLHDANRFFRDLATPVSTLVMCYVMFMKGQSAIAKTLVLGGTMLILVAITAVGIYF